MRRLGGFRALIGGGKGGERGGCMFMKYDIMGYDMGFGKVYLYFNR